ncbi:hypothetical protein [Ascidiimonas sp. W6]|uniref:hypothetical protein n=1 Tax=Ascidiimonas meishanensis TaxID=3128903 RepID=UPI0030EEB8A7
MINLTNAQNSADIIGMYSLGASSPEGGSHLLVLENNNYAIAYFGGIQTGKWKITQENTYKFTPDNKESRFELFGRHNKVLKNETKIFFSGFEDDQTFIQLRTTKEDEYIMQQVFNTDANCFSFPYVHTFKTIANSISLLFKRYQEEASPIFSFKNPEGYNDFVANFIQVDRYDSQPFFTVFKDDKLYFNDHKFAQRKPLDENHEDIEFIKNIMDKELHKNTIYLNPFYNTFKEDIHEYHIFNEQKNAFIDKEYYVEDEEYSNTDDSFESMSIIYAYKLLKEFTKEPVEYKINKSSLFQANCD